MSVNIKNIVIITALVGVTIPFVLVTDLFPFLRFGMFAETVVVSAQQEIFQLTFIDSTNKERVFEPLDVGIPPHFFYYLTRNYYYRNESEKLIENIEAIDTKKTTEWRLKKITLYNKSLGNRADTTIVYRKIYE